ncbi:MAG: helix-turn-helix domain-containing protein [Gammaproteobacteria bacterium]|nr:helix-turn-helix domain-containing protein [Gammaproteobacteria bacterium]
MVESLFDRMGDLFLEHIVREREEVDRLQRELALQKKLICEPLARLKGNVSATAKSLGLTRQTLYARMDSYDIDRSKWRRRSSGG